MPRTSKPPSISPETVARVEKLVAALTEQMTRPPRQGPRPPSGVALSFAQYRVLAQACAEEGMLVGDVSRLLGIARSSATEMVARMEHEGLVTKSRDARDARIVRLLPTRLGRQLASRRRGHHHEAFEGLLAQLSCEEAHQLVDALETLGRLLAKARSGGAR